MGEFLAFVLIVFAAVWGSVFLAHLLKQSSQKLDSGGDEGRLARLQEETEHLERRLAIVEDELGFFKELRAPDGPPGLAAPDAGDDTSIGTSAGGTDPSPELPPPFSKSRPFLLVGLGILGVGFATWRPVPAGVRHDDGVYMARLWPE